MLIEEAIFHDSTAGLSIKKEEESTKNLSQQTKQQFNSWNSRTMEEQPLPKTVHTAL